MVWPECRRQAADNFSEWSQEPAIDGLQLSELSEKYRELARLLGETGNRTRTVEQKTAWVTAARCLKEECVQGLGQLLQRMWGHPDTNV